MNSSTILPAIEISVTVKATPERVYQALTDARDLERWFASKVETDPRVGGKYKFTWHSQDPTHDHSRTGEFTELVPGKKVAYTWNAGAMKFGVGMQDQTLPTTVEFLLEAVEDGTKVTLKHTGWGEGPEWHDMFEGHSGGWPVFLKNLKSMLEGGTDNRCAELNMRVNS